MKKIDQVKIPRSLTPKDPKGLPMLVVFSVGSSKAYGAVAYIRWKVEGGYS